MNLQQNRPASHEVVIYNDQVTPIQFVSRLISEMTGVPLYQAQEVAQRIHVVGKHVFGPYTQAVAEAFYDAAKEEIDKAGHSLPVELVDLAKPNEAGVKVCSFCGKASAAVPKMFASQRANICSECVLGVRVSWRVCCRLLASNSYGNCWTGILVTVP